MVKHIVLFNLTPDDKRSNGERIGAIRLKAHEMLETIPGVLRVEVLENYKPGGQDLCLYLEFDSPASEETYQTHTTHLAFGKAVGHELCDRVVFDAEL